MNFTYVSVAFLVLELLIVGIGILMGYRRGVGRSAVRMVYLVAIGFISFFVGRSLAFRLSDTAISAVLGMVPEAVKPILDSAPGLKILIASIVGALMVPLLFAVLFGLLQLITLIFFKTISGKLVSTIYRKEEAPRFSKWAGAGVGLVSGLAVAAVLLSPIFTVMYLVESTPDETISIFTDVIFGEEQVDEQVVAAAFPVNTLRTQTNLLAPAARPNFNSSLNVSQLNPWSVALLKVLTGYELDDDDIDAILSEDEDEDETASNNGNKDNNSNKGNNKNNGNNSGKDKNGNNGKKNSKKTSAADSLPALLEAAGDALYAYKETEAQGGTSTDAFTNAAAALVPYLEEPTIRKATAEALSAVGETLKTEDSVMGFELPKSDNELIQSLVDEMVNTLADTNTETVADNMKTLFGELPDDLKPESKRQKAPEVETEADTEIETEADTEAPDVNADTEASTGSDTNAPETPETSAPADSDKETSKETAKETEKETEKTGNGKDNGNNSGKDKEKDKNGKKDVTNKGLLSALTKIDTTNPENTFKDETTSEVIKEALGNAFDNPNLTSLMSQIRSYAMKMISDAGVDFKDVQFKPVYEAFCSELESTLSQCLISGVKTNKEAAALLQDAMEVEFAAHNFPVESYMIGLMAQCAAAEFLKAPYANGTTVSVSVSDIMSFFGVAASEMPDWVN